MERFEEVFKDHTSKLAYVCGAGVSKAISDDSLTWRELLDEYAKQTQKAFDLDPNWPATLEDEENLEVRADRITEEIRRHTHHQGPSLHRLLMQPIFRQMKPHNKYPADILDAAWIPILTTNYDTLLEDSMPRRLSISHIDALELGVRFFGDTDVDDDRDAGVPCLGQGVFSRSGGLFVTHLHGRYFDVGSEHGFCLTTNEYTNPGKLEMFLQFMKPFAMDHSLIFVGANGTISDYHFTELWKRVGEETRQRGLPSRPHFVLCTDDEAEEQEWIANVDILNAYGAEIIIVPCGLYHFDVWNVLHQLTRYVAG